MAVGNCPPVIPTVHRFLSSFAAVVAGNNTAAGGGGNPYIDLMDTDPDSSEAPIHSMHLTANQSPTFVSSGNPNLDFFFQVVPSTNPTVTANLLSASWIHNPLITLKLVCNLRGVGGTGKSDREGFYTCAMWMHHCHPKTLALNVASFAEFGYMKDLLEILYRILNGSDIRKLNREEQEKRDREASGAASARKNSIKKKMKMPTFSGFGNQVEMDVDRPGDAVTKQMDDLKVLQKKFFKRSKRSEMAVKASEKYDVDANFHFLFDRVSQFFADLLLSDVEKLKSGKFDQISLAAKWCPSLDSSFDKSLNICASIAKKMWPKDSVDEYKYALEEHYVYKVRNRLRKEVLVPIRRVLELPEAYMSSGKWESIPYSKVSSVAMMNYAKTFQKRDGDGFQAYLKLVKEGKEKIAAGALLPHEILWLSYNDETQEVAELQWNQMIKDLTEKGRFKNCISICDISASMSPLSRTSSIALGLVLSELSEAPWKGRLFTFEDSPKLHSIKGATITEKARPLVTMDCSGKFNLVSVFDRILEVAKKEKLSKESMVKRVYVFSNMEFEKATGSSNWETNYMSVRRKFGENGYGDRVPEIVFWNLQDSSSMPVLADQKGVALVSGFSKNVMKVFLEGDGVVDPVAVMDAAVSGKEYEKLVVFD